MATRRQRNQHNWTISVQYMAPVCVCGHRHREHPCMTCACTALAPPEVDVAQIVADLKELEDL